MPPNEVNNKTLVRSVSCSQVNIAFACVFAKNVIFAVFC